MKIASTVYVPREPQEPGTHHAGLLNWVRGFIRIFVEAYRNIAEAVNRNHVALTTTAPTDAPDYGEPTMRVYKSGGVRRLYVYVDGGWHYVTLT
ncbi:MAG: hypothetical protein V2A77_04530 [Pseudomonadota bacterium]